MRLRGEVKGGNGVLVRFMVFLSLLFVSGTVVSFDTATIYASSLDEGRALLKEVQEKITVSGDRVSVQRMRLVDADGTERVRGMKTYELGEDRTLITFTEPADVKGVSVLTLPGNTIYMYMPAFGKVRRIASHIKNQNFMGTDFSYEDISMNYVDNYDVIGFEKTGEEETPYYLELRPKPDSEISYSKLNMWMNKDRVPVLVEYFGKDGELSKRMTVRPELVGDYWEMTYIEMETVGTGHKTIIELSKVEHDTGLKQDFFSPRNLRRIGR